ncbi:MAG: ATP-dependent helicase [Acidimicrobiaceae bacterium]
MHFRDSDTTTRATTPESVLAGLDPDQRAAVTAPVGIVVVRAGAGSGKTTVLTRRIAWRALSGSSDIERTLAITFTRQAATEMRTRLAQFSLDGRPTIGTFHAVARRMMLQQLEDKGRRSPVIINNRSSVVSQCMGDDARGGGVTDVLNAIDWAHARMLTPHNAAAALTSSGLAVPLGNTRFSEVFDAYERTKKKRGLVDLNDFLTSVIRDGVKDPRFVESLQFQFRHISVDEAQDMNPLQYEFLKTILSANPDVFLVGDPNQAIYGFNGADKSLFDSLPDIEGATTVVSLPSNYRCTPEIVTMAVATLAQDGQVADAKSTRVNGQPVLLKRCANEQAEIATVAKEVLRGFGRGRSWSDIAVLTRVNTTADHIRDALSAAGIPVRTARRGGAWGRAVAAATELTGREGLAVWSSDILDSGEYEKDDADYLVAQRVRQFLDENRVGSVDGRTFGTWLATSADVSETDGVDVLTFHAAKGREWSFVVVAGVEKGMLPHRSARGASARSEEARLAYVALTRAADELVITWTDTRNGRSTGPSPFLPTVTTDIPQPAAPPEELRAFHRSLPQRNQIEDELREWRDAHAHSRRVEPDAVLPDRSIKRLVRVQPSTVDEIAQIVDAVFAHRYGEEILTILRNSPTA